MTVLKGHLFEWANKGDTPWLAEDGIPTNVATHGMTSGLGSVRDPARTLSSISSGALEQGQGSRKSWGFSPASQRLTGLGGVWRPLTPTLLVYKRGRMHKLAGQFAETPVPTGAGGMAAPVTPHLRMVPLHLNIWGCRQPPRPVDHPPFT